MRIIPYMLLLLFPALVKAGTGVAALAPDSLDPIAELYRIEYFYQRAHIEFTGTPADISFYFTYKETDKDPCYETVIREYDVALRAYDEKLWMYADNDITVIQDSLYCVTVYSSDSVIYLFKPRAVYKHLLLMDLRDPKLYQGQVRDIAITDSTDAVTGTPLRKLLVRFNNQSPYICYQLVYDRTNYSLWNVQYYKRKEPANQDAPWFMPNAWTRYELNKNGHYIDQQSIDHSVFATDRVFRKRQGQYEPLEPYTGYTIINNSSF